MELPVTNRYRVLTSEFLKNLYLKIECTDEVARLISLEPEFDWEMITEMDLSQQNLVQIVGLRLVTNLRRLRMAQNHIDAIQNVEWLTKLEHLDLSFNRIARIENLDTLTALTLLNLGGNKITELENLDHNVLLETIVVSDNRIMDVRQLGYLKRFTRLRYMSVDNNPGTVDARKQIVDQFPELLYLDSVRITAEERPDPGTLPVEEDAGGGGGGGGDGGGDGFDEGDPRVQRLAFLNDADGRRFFNRLYEDDEDGRLLARWNGKVQVAFATYGKHITEVAMNVCEASLKNLAVRNERKFAFHTAYHRFERKWTIGMQDTLKEYEEIKNIRFRSMKENIEKAVEAMDDAELLAIFVQLDSPNVLNVVYNADLEVMANRLHVQNIYMNKSILAMVDVYEKILDDEMKAFVERLVPVFFNMHKIKNDYLQVLSDCVKFDVNNPHKILPTQYTDHFEDRFAIVQAVYKSNDKHADIIYKREEDMKSDAREWNKRIIKELRDSERQRFFMVIEEIRRYQEQASLYFNTLMTG